MYSSLYSGEQVNRKWNTVHWCTWSKINQALMASIFILNKMHKISPFKCHINLRFHHVQGRTSFIRVILHMWCIFEALTYSWIIVSFWQQDYILAQQSLVVRLAVALVITPQIALKLIDWWTECFVSNISPVSLPERICWTLKQSMFKKIYEILTRPDSNFCPY